MPPSEGQEPRALTVAAQAIEGRKCAETAKVPPDLRIVYNLACGILAGEAGRFSLVGDYTTKFQSKGPSYGWAFFRFRASITYRLLVVWNEFQRSAEYLVRLGFAPVVDQDAGI